MIPNYHQNILYFEFPNFKAFPEIVHAVFTRKGGCSKPPFQSLNITTDIGDSEISVRKNRERISVCLDNSRLVFADQVHGTDVIVCSEKNDSPGSTAGQKGDAMISDISGKGFVIQTADCQAVMLYDPVRKVVGNIHSGWRGSIRNLIGKTVHAMKENFGSAPANLVAGIGPSLGPCCAEFINFRNEIPSALHIYKNDRHYFDFWRISADQLTEAGVLNKNICISHMCTKCRTDLFYSYRGEKTTGRFASVIGLR